MRASALGMQGGRRRPEVGPAVTAISVRQRCPSCPRSRRSAGQLAPALAGRRIVAAAGHPSAKFALGRRGGRRHASAASRRRGKYLLVDLDDDRELVVHLGMTGPSSSSPADATGHRRPTRTCGPGGGSTAAIVLRAARHPPVRAGRGACRRRPRQPADAGRARPRAVVRRLHRRGAVRGAAAQRRPVEDAAAQPAGRRGGRQHLRRRGAVGERHRPGVRRAVTRPQPRPARGAASGARPPGIANGGTTLRDYRTFAGETGRNQHDAALLRPGRAAVPALRRHRCGGGCIDGRSTTSCRSAAS